MPRDRINGPLIALRMDNSAGLTGLNESVGEKGGGGAALKSSAPVRERRGREGLAGVRGWAARARPAGNWGEAGPRRFSLARGGCSRRGAAAPRAATHMRPGVRARRDLVEHRRRICGRAAAVPAPRGNLVIGDSKNVHRF